MKPGLSYAFGIALLLSLPSCANEVSGNTGGSSGSTGSTSTGSTGETTTTGTGTPSDWTTLIQGTWSLPPGTEAYWCALKTFPEDTYIKAFRALAPPGTHHTLLLEQGGGQPDGEYPCGPTLGADMIFASGVGSDDLVFADGIAAKIPAGTQLQLNLHLFNTTSAPLEGVSGTLVQLAPASEVKQVAELVLPGTTTIAVPPFGTQTVQAKCSFPNATTIFSVWPHMHQYGTHMTVTYGGSQGTKVLHDGAYSFGEQKNYPITPITAAPGDFVTIACSYKNDTGQTITFGDSSKAEMCFGGLYLYPQLVPGIQCQ